MKLPDKIEGPFAKWWLDRMKSHLMKMFPDCPERLFIKEEQMVNFARIMLIIDNSAKDEKSINESERLTYKHIVAMKRATIRLLKQFKSQILILAP